ncbi:MAG: hypothetical protein HY431_00050 [Candidatus Levybacteria bacterium]|nr:hypothetical protein [Candidatus Levybacteria bacterium]
MKEYLLPWRRPQREALPRIDATWERLRTPDGVVFEQVVPNNSQGDPLIIAPGFGRFARELRPTLEFFAAHHIQAACLEHPRFGLPVKNNPHNFARESMRGAQAVISVIEAIREQRPEVQRFEGFGESRGSISIGIAKILDPDGLGHVYFASPANMTRDNFAALLGGIVQQVIMERKQFAQQGETDRVIADVIKLLQYLSNPVRSLIEGYHIADTNLSEHLSLFVDDITIIITEHDELFAIQEIQQNAKAVGISDIVVFPGNHRVNMTDVSKLIAARRRKVAA